MLSTNVYSDEKHAERPEVQATSAKRPKKAKPAIETRTKDGITYYAPGSLENSDNRVMAHSFRRSPTLMRGEDLYIPVLDQTDEDTRSFGQELLTYNEMSAMANIWNHFGKGDNKMDKILVLFSGLGFGVRQLLKRTYDVVLDGKKTGVAHYGAFSEVWFWDCREIMSGLKATVLTASNNPSAKSAGAEKLVSCVEKKNANGEDCVHIKIDEAAKFPIIFLSLPRASEGANGGLAAQERFHHTMAAIKEWNKPCSVFFIQKLEGELKKDTNSGEPLDTHHPSVLSSLLQSVSKHPTDFFVSFPFSGKSIVWYHHRSELDCAGRVAQAREVYEGLLTENDRARKAVEEKNKGAGENGKKSRKPQRLASRISPTLFCSDSQGVCCYPLIGTADGKSLSAFLRGSSKIKTNLALAGERVPSSKGKPTAASAGAAAAEAKTEHVVAVDLSKLKIDAEAAVTESKKLFAEAKAAAKQAKLLKKQHQDASGKGGGRGVAGAAKNNVAGKSGKNGRGKGRGRGKDKKEKISVGAVRSSLGAGSDDAPAVRERIPLDEFRGRDDDD